MGNKRYTYWGNNPQANAISSLAAAMGNKRYTYWGNNPQANAISERMHQVGENILPTTLHTNPPQNKANAIGGLRLTISSLCYENDGTSKVRYRPRIIGFSS